MHWRYLKAVLRHKRFVYEEGRKLGLSVWRCLIHDWQKFTPTEWLPYARAFYGPSSQTKTGKPQGDPAFDRAWLHHQKFGPHHWQYWVMMEDSGNTLCLDMPDVYRREMLADWRGANRAYGDIPLTTWYIRGIGKRKIHGDTLDWIEEQIGITFCTECNRYGVPVDACIGGWCGLRGEQD